jgi:hypothetical protein
MYWGSLDRFRLDRIEGTANDLRTLVVLLGRARNIDCPVATDWF